jgi:hypothetical protein
LSTQSNDLNSQKRHSRRRQSRRIFELVLFAMLGALMFCSDLIMEALPNIHILGMLIVVYTIVFRWKALIPLYVYVLLMGVFSGLAEWWVPYLYIWTLLWGAVMLLPRRMPRSIAYVAYTTVCALHGLLFGVLYAPFYALIYRTGWAGMIAWIVAGFHFDLLHFFGNLGAGLFIVPVAELLSRLNRKYLR